MTDEEVLALWEALPAEAREQVDDLARKDKTYGIVVLLQTAHGLSIPQGLGIAVARHALLRPPVPDGPVDPRVLIRKAGEVEERVLAVEAVWAGDLAHGWFVWLFAIGTTRDHPLEPVYASTATRHLGSEESDDGRPHIAVAAEMIGVAVARALRVPFHFASPRTPDGRAPRWVRPSTS
ncbi:hypothetical protein ACIHEI_19775 [Kitasatospora sp. NPDC051984]|uniref:hypothetical protein n=1 Tax=Kitasatospora sp. NPDC051984 TaxID=3364059 RepID=UPI0037CC385C